MLDWVPSATPPVLTYRRSPARPDVVELFHDGRAAGWGVRVRHPALAHCANPDADHWVLDSWEWQFRIAPRPCLHSWRDLVPWVDGRPELLLPIPAVLSYTTYFQGTVQFLYDPDCTTCHGSGNTIDHTACPCGVPGHQAPTAWRDLDDRRRFLLEQAMLARAQPTPPGGRHAAP